LLLSLFFFHCSPPHRDLPSFPTRRSSDLRKRLQAAPFSHQLTLNTILPMFRFSSIRRWASRTDSQEKTLSITGFSRPSRKRGRADRKSTRLNSSHVKISYAVFCLKKKKKQ